MRAATCNERPLYFAYRTWHRSEQHRQAVTPPGLAPPSLQRLGAEALVRLEHKLVEYGKGNVLELLQVGAAVLLGQDSAARCLDRCRRCCCRCCCW